MSQIKSSPDGRPQVYRINVEMTPPVFLYSMSPVENWPFPLTYRVRQFTCECIGQATIVVPIVDFPPGSSNPSLDVALMQFMMVGVTNTNPADPTYPLWYVGQSIPQLQTLWHRIMMPPQSNPFQPQPGYPITSIPQDQITSLGTITISDIPDLEGLTPGTTSLVFEEFQYGQNTQIFYL